MPRNYAIAGACATILWCFLPPAAAHHSSSGYDLGKTIELRVTVTKFEFVNPHAYVFFTLPDANGKPAEGRCELPALTALSRLGWTRTTFRPGQKVTIKGAPARHEENVCMLQSFIGEDGREISRTEDLTKTGASAALNPPTANPRATRPARLPNGRPNLQGLWLAVGGPDGRGPLNRGIGELGRGGPPPPGGRGRGGPPRPEVTPAGALAARDYDQPFDDPAIKCDPANILFAWVHDRHVNEIVQKNDEIILKYGYMDLVRTIHMNMPEHPKNLVPSRAGHSIGSWDGDVLVVDTTGFLPGVLIPIIGVMHSDRLHVVERFTLDEKQGTLTRSYVAEDPLYLKKPYTGQDVMAISGEPYQPYRCVELSGRNNLRPKN